MNRRNFLTTIAGAIGASVPDIKVKAAKELKTYEQECTIHVGDTLLHNVVNYTSLPNEFVLDGVQYYLVNVEHEWDCYHIFEYILSQEPPNRANVTPKYYSRFLGKNITQVQLTACHDPYPITASSVDKDRVLPVISYYLNLLLEGQDAL